MANENVTTKVVIPCRFSYVHVWDLIVLCRLTL